MYTVSICNLLYSNLCISYKTFVHYKASGCAESPPEVFLFLRGVMLTVTALLSLGNGTHILYIILYLYIHYSYVVYSNILSVQLQRHI